jgi:hypothetical protein
MQREHPEPRYPLAIDISAEPQPGDLTPATFTRTVGQRLGQMLGAKPDMMTLLLTAPTVPVTARRTKHRIAVGGSVVVIKGSPDPFLLSWPTYEVEVDGRPAPYEFTWDRPIVDLLAEAAHRVISEQEAAPSAGA